LRRGITANVGVVEGGTRSNVIAAEASALIDVRIAKVRDAAYVDKRLHALKPLNRQCRLELNGAINRLPMERTPGVARLFATAKRLAKELDWNLQETSTGGASDGNFTAALGVPTLDGMGGVGEGAHAFNESVIIDELPRRAALIAMLIEAV
jgi:glutamate carboxypeptidase